MQSNTPKHFVIQLGALIALYASIVSILVLIFGVINLRFPDEAAYYYESESARQAIRTAMASLVVFFPTFLVLTRTSNQNRRKESNGEYVGLTRWLIYISLLVAAGIMLGDLVTLINYFLNGEITNRFLAKVFALLFVVGGAFHYYMLDVRGYFYKRVTKSLYFAMGACVMVFTALTYSYQYIETPSEVREMRFDEQQIQDLQSMQSYVENYYVTSKRLPVTIADAYGAIPIPTAPDMRASYTYTVTGDESYKLCATFAAPSSDITETYAVAPEKNYNWSHQAGVWCFDRVTPMDAQGKFDAAPL